ncbi:MAG: nuclear transport factor 2 family protein [Verrucomicrobiota bacterium]
MTCLGDIELKVITKRMTRQHQITAGLIALVLVAAYLFFFSEGDDEAQLNALLDRVSELAEKNAPEGQLDALTKAQKIAGCFTDQVELRLPRMSLLGTRQELSGRVVAARNAMQRLEVSLSGRRFQVSENGRTASVNLTATARMEVHGDQESHRAPYQFQFEKVDGDWLISAIKPLDD